jgi:hypothetical protein
MTRFPSFCTTRKAPGCPSVPEVQVTLAATEPSTRSRAPARPTRPQLPIGHQGVRRLVRPARLAQGQPVSRASRGRGPPQEGLADWLWRLGVRDSAVRTAVSGTGRRRARRSRRLSGWGVEAQRQRRSRGLGFTSNSVLQAYADWAGSMIQSIGTQILSSPREMANNVRASYDGCRTVNGLFRSCQRRKAANSAVVAK